MRFRYLTALYGFSANQSHIAVPDLGEKKLCEMGNDLAGGDDLVAIYIPEGTEDVYHPGNKRGRVVGAVRLLLMSEDQSIRDYFFDDWDGSRRWPIGWPCRVVYAPPVEECPRLRTIVDAVFEPNSFGPYVGQLLRGPFRLDRKVANKLEAWFHCGGTLEPSLRPLARSYVPAMNDLAYWTTKLQDAERELDTATRRSDVDAAAKRLMRIKAELKALERRAPARPAPGAAAPTASA
jgi:hypothetical protein